MRNARLKSGSHARLYSQGTRGDLARTGEAWRPKGRTTVRAWCGRPGARHLPDARLMGRARGSIAHKDSQYKPQKGTAPRGVGTDTATFYDSFHTNC